MEFRIVL